MCIENVNIIVKKTFPAVILSDENYDTSLQIYVFNYDNASTRSETHKIPSNFTSSHPIP
jgi:hypothetical protein